MEEIKNVYQKLILARKEFLDSKVKKSGKNIHLEFMYFELSDIVPVITNIFANIGLIGVTSFTDEEATLTIFNCDQPSEQIVFTSPMRDVPAIVSAQGKSVTNPVQTLGSIETYQRRYLYLMALDIVENDSFDNALGTPEVKTPAPTKKSAASPKDSGVTLKKEEVKVATPEERKAIAKDLTSSGDVMPTLEERIAFSELLNKLVNVNPKEREFAVQVVARTSNLTKITKQQIEVMTKAINDKIEKASGVEQAPTQVAKPVSNAEKIAFKNLLTKLVVAKPEEKEWVTNILITTNKLGDITSEQLTQWTNEITGKLGSN